MPGLAVALALGLAMALALATVKATITGIATVLALGGVLPVLRPVGCEQGLGLLFRARQRIGLGLGLE